MVRIAVCVAVALVLLAAGAVWGEQETVSLLYTFEPGQELSYQLEMTGSGVTRTAPASAEEPAQVIPMEMRMTMVLTQRVVQMYDDGSALVEMTSDGMTMQMRIEAGDQPKEVEMHFADDKVTIVTPEGTQEMPVGEAGVGVGPPFTAPMRMRMTPRGEVLWFEAPGMEQVAQMMGGADISQMIRAGETPFPDRPIAPGESWEYTMDFPLPGSEKEVEMQMAAELAHLEQVDGSRIATIAVDGSLDMGGVTFEVPNQPGVEITFDALTEEIVGEFDFDADRGYMTRAAYDIDLAMEMDVPRTGQSPSPGTMSMTMQMNMEMTLQ